MLPGIVPTNWALSEFLFFPAVPFGRIPGLMWELFDFHGFFFSHEKKTVLSGPSRFQKIIIVFNRFRTTQAFLRAFLMTLIKRQASFFFFPPPCGKDFFFHSSVP